MKVIAELIEPPVTLNVIKLLNERVVEAIVKGACAAFVTVTELRQSKES